MTSEVKLHLISAKDKAEQAKLDVVFIHGLGGHWETTWRAEKGGSTWPELLAQDRPELNVWSLEYPALLGSWRASKAQQQLGTPELEPRISRSLSDKGVAKSAGRPCVLVCHSLGGIVAKRLLLSANEQTADNAIDHLQVAGVLFLGTPHRGSAMADILKMAESTKGVVGDVASKALELFGALAGVAAPMGGLLQWTASALFASSTLIDELTEGNSDLQRLNERFITYWNDRISREHPLHVRICAESHKLHLIDKYVVDFDSADPNLHTTAGPALPILKLPYNHMQICKIADLNSEVNSYLGGLIKDCLGDPDSIDLSLPPHTYQAFAAIGRLIESDDAIRVALINQLQLPPSAPARIVRNKLMGKADMVAAAEAVGSLAACLSNPLHGVALNLARMDEMVGWLMVAGLSPEACSTAPNRVSAFAIPPEAKGQGADLDAALLETSLARALKRIPAIPAQNQGNATTTFAPHVITADSVTARHIDPEGLITYLSRRVLDEVKPRAVVPLRLALSLQDIEGEASLGEYERSTLQGRVHGLSSRGRGIGLDDRRQGNFVNNRSFDIALANSPLSAVLFVIGAPVGCDAPRDLGQFGEELLTYLEERFDRLPTARV